MQLDDDPESAASGSSRVRGRIAGTSDGGGFCESSASDRRAGCKVGHVTRLHGVSAAKGKVKSQNPKPGVSVTAGAKVAVKLG